MKVDADWECRVALARCGQTVIRKPESSLESAVLVTAIAKGRGVRLFAGAEEFVAVGIGGPFERDEFGFLVRSVAKGLFGGLAASAPEIVLVTRNFDLDGRFASYLAFHEITSLLHELYQCGTLRHPIARVNNASLSMK